MSKHKGTGDGEAHSGNEVRIVCACFLGVVITFSSGPAVSCARRWATSASSSEMICTRARGGGGGEDKEGKERMR